MILLIRDASPPNCGTEEKHVCCWVLGTTTDKLLRSLASLLLEITQKMDFIKYHLFSEPFFITDICLIRMIKIISP